MQNDKRRFQFFFQNRFLLIIFLIGLLLNLTAWIIFWLGLDFDKTALILHYNSFFGIDRIAINSEDRNFLDVFFVAFSGLIILLVNSILGGFLICSKQNKLKNVECEKKKLDQISASTLGGYFLVLSGLILQIVILVYTIAIVLVNH